jgi:hypothetical protein
MFLTMDDTSRVASWGLELGKSNKKFIEISNFCLEELSGDFLEVFKQVLRQNKYKNIQERVKRPKEGKELLLNHKVDLPFDERKIHIRYKYSSNLIRDFEIDKSFIEECFFDEKAYKQSKHMRDIAKGER